MLVMLHDEDSVIHTIAVERCSRGSMEVSIALCLILKCYFECETMIPYQRFISFLFEYFVTLLTRPW